MHYNFQCQAETFYKEEKIQISIMCLKIFLMFIKKIYIHENIFLNHLLVKYDKFAMEFIEFILQPVSEN